MSKRILLISFIVVALTAATLQPAEAREFRSTKNKTEKSAPKVKKSKAVKPSTAADQNATTVRAEKPVNDVKAEKVVKTKKAEKSSATKSSAKSKASQKSSSTSNGSVSTVSTSTSKSAYAALQNEQLLLSEQIGVLSEQLASSSKGKAKKISKQIDALTAKLTAVERRMDSFAESIKNPSSVSPVEIDEQFARELDAKVAQRVAAADPYAGQLSADAELDKLYRQRLGDNSKGADKLTYRVMIAISKSPLAKSSFTGLSEVVEQRMANGNIVYYQGSYSSFDEAQRSCQKILSARKFRDAFVVAMQGEKRVALP